MRSTRILALTLTLLAVTLLIPWHAAQAAQSQEILKKNHFTIRKIGDPCKLEITFSMADLVEKKGSKREYVAILSLFNDDKYLSEFFTDRQRIGMAREKLVVQFDREKPIVVPFQSNQDGKDRYWRWRYLDESKSSTLLENVARKNSMRIKFTNGNSWWEFKIPLKGTSRIVKQLKRCGR